LLVAVNPTGVITGFGLACASTKDQPLAETFFALLRREPNPSRAPSVGSAAAGPYVTDKGFEGEENYRRWLECYGARLVCPPRRNGRKRRWPKKRLRRCWVANIRQQIVETVYEKLHNTSLAFAENEHTSSAGCGLAWRLGLRCTTSASGSMSNSVVLG